MINSFRVLFRGLSWLANGVIALAVFTQCLTIAIVTYGSPGKVPPWLIVWHSRIEFSVGLGIAFAFFGFVVGALQGSVQWRAWWRAAGYLFLTLVILAVFRWAPTDLEAAMTPRDPVVLAKEKDFQAGFEWARNNQPQRASLCQGSLAFIKGCRMFHTRYLKKPKPAGEGHYEGMTTAVCKEEVTAELEARIQDYLEHGNTQGAELLRRNELSFELNNCENFDRVGDGKLLAAAYFHVDRTLKALRNGEWVADSDIEKIEADFEAIKVVSDQPYRAAYLNLIAEYRDYRSRNPDHPEK